MEFRPFLLGRGGTIDFSVIVDVVSYESVSRISIGLGMWSPGKKDSTLLPFSLTSPFTFSAPSSKT